ncbi:hypothetical protein [Microbaculum sp. FT89]|uniref:hypothetical protein n=1 Tax=Microbaculum sp. FT89 TaxID=3447298 RepID=UPI003F5387FB
MDRSAFLGTVLGAAALAVFFAGPARADAIDGTWCAADGRIMEIHGPAITTPGGTEAIGDYSRHAFSYEVPDGETAAGTTVRMVLASEDIIHLKVGEQAADPEVWQRCDTVSRLHVIPSVSMLISRPQCLQWIASGSCSVRPQSGQV